MATVKCPNCGAENKVTARNGQECAYCGTFLEWPKKSTPKNEKKKIDKELEDLSNEPMIIEFDPDVMNESFIISAFKHALIVDSEAPVDIFDHLKIKSAKWAYLPMLRFNVRNTNGYDMKLNIDEENDWPFCILIPCAKDIDSTYDDRAYRCMYFPKFKKGYTIRKYDEKVQYKNLYKGELYKPDDAYMQDILEDYVEVVFDDEAGDFLKEYERDYISCDKTLEDNKGQLLYIPFAQVEYTYKDKTYKGEFIVSSAKDRNAKRISNVYIACYDSISGPITEDENKNKDEDTLLKRLRIAVLALSAIVVIIGIALCIIEELWGISFIFVSPLIAVCAGLWDNDSNGHSNSVPIYIKNISINVKKRVENYIKNGGVIDEKYQLGYDIKQLEYDIKDPNEELSENKPKPIKLVLMIALIVLTVLLLVGITALI